MERLKKLSVALLAVVTALALAVPALAAPALAQEGSLGGGSIEIDNAVKGQEYKAYQVMYLESYNSANNAYSYKANSAWKNWLKEQTDYVSIDDQGYVTWKEGASAADFAKAALEYAKESRIEADASSTADSTTVEFSNLKLGYYLVDSSLGSLCSLDTTNPSVTIKEKNAEPTNEKTVQENSTGDYGSSNDANIGDVVSFQSTITAQAGAEKYVFHDTMSSGLTYDNVTGVTLNGRTVNASSYQVVSKGLTDGCTFEVRFTQAFCDTLKAKDKVVISYTATVNSKAAIAGDGNSNESELSYGDKGKTTVSDTKTYVWRFDILKYGNGDKAQTLEGAKFVLLSSDKKKVATFVDGKLANWTAVPATGEDWPSSAVLTTNEQGKASVSGIDSGTYYLRETAAPSGYNKLTDDVTVAIDPTTGADGKTMTLSPLTVEVDNQSGSELPSTGGIGTIVLYAIGAVLVIGAVAGIVVLKRRTAQHR